MTLSAGVRLGPYEIVAPIGAGGMGEVYRARDSRLGRDVAVKVLPAAFAADPDRLRRFELEARATSLLNHSNILSVFDIGTHDGTPYIVTEFLEGKTLREYLPGLPRDQALGYARQIAKGLAAAHAKGVTHRDLKPENLFITDDGNVKILDFGLAKLFEQEAGETAMLTLTTPGVAMGTAGYMSPEQARGQSVDQRSDIFSFGVILYEMIAGARPFAGGSAIEVMHAVIKEDPPPLADAVLQPLVRHCLEKNPEQRLQSARDLVFRLDNLSDAKPTSGAHPPPVAAVVRTKATRRWIAAAAILVATLAMAALAFRSYPPSVAHSSVRSLAVLPLVNHSESGASQEFFAEGMTDELTSNLAGISGLRVISRGSAGVFTADHRPSASQIARTLNVDALVEGSVARSGDKVRCTVRLIDAAADKVIWSDSLERTSKDVLALQNELASAIATEIHVRLTPSEQSRLKRKQELKPEAHDAYLKGRYFFNRPSDENLLKAIAQFEVCVRIEPGFAPAWSGLSDAYTWMGYNEGALTASEARPKAIETANKAIQLDNDSAESHTSLATFKFWYEYDWAGAEAEYRHSFALNPNYAYAHDQFSLELAFLGRFDESAAEGTRAATLDPLSPQILLDAQIGHFYHGNLVEARRLITKAAELAPDYFFSPWSFGKIDLEQGKPAAAVEQFRKSKSLGAPPFVSAWLGHALAASGDRPGALAELADQKKIFSKVGVPPFNLAIIHLGLGERASALDELERAYASDSEWLAWLKYDHIFDSLRKEPRFTAILRKIRLAP